MNARLYICIPCRNRRAIAELCLPTVKAGAVKGDEMVCYNDGSSEYGSEFLHGCGADVVVDGRNIGIQAQRRNHLKEFLNRIEFTHLYFTDLDAMHDPTWRSHGLRLQQEYGGAVCLYNTQAHVRLQGNTIEDDPAKEVIFRGVAPGISYLLTRAQVEGFKDYIPVLQHFDWEIPALLGNRFTVSRVSFVDHIGYGGERHPAKEGYDGGDVALNPTARLIQMRREVVTKLKADETQSSH